MASLITNFMQGPLCGTLATMLLYGVICMQVYHYANNYASSDRNAIKWLIWIIWVLETIHTAFSIHFIEYYLILHFDDPAALSNTVWTMGATYITGFLVAWAVDLFFVWRIWQLGKQALICIFLAVLATTRTGVGIANASLGFKYTAVKDFLAVVHPSMIAGWTLSACADTLIAITLCYNLHRQRSGIKRTNHVINTLLLYTINTGALTSFFAILVIITFLALPGGMDFTAFVQVQSKLYAVSILASLNVRNRTLESARRAVLTMNNVSLPLPRISQSGGKLDQSLTPALEVRKDVDVETFSSTMGSSSYA
ncbi:hypothetical protein OG21DRAFT_1466112 [Imleria badia]|nr:hypothetical protein OG21DRAFT_1466112 [Imleria badia]